MRRNEQQNVKHVCISSGNIRKSSVWPQSYACSMLLGRKSRSPPVTVRITKKLQNQSLKDDTFHCQTQGAVRTHTIKIRIMPAQILFQEGSGSHHGHGHRHSIHRSSRPASICCMLQQQGKASKSYLLITAARPTSQDFPTTITTLSVAASTRLL